MFYSLLLQTLAWLVSYPEIDPTTPNQGTAFFIPDRGTNPQNQLEAFGLVVGAKIYLSPAGNQPPLENEPIDLERTITQTSFDPTTNINQIWFTPARSNWPFQAYVTILRGSDPEPPNHTPNFYASPTPSPAADLIAANILKATTPP